MNHLFNLKNLLLLTTVSLLLPLFISECSAQPKNYVKVFYSSTSPSSHTGDKVYVTLRTQEGLERFIFTASDLNIPNNTNITETHYQGFSRPRNFQRQPLASAMSVSQTHTWIFFTSRRTGRPVAVSIAAANQGSSNPPTARIRVSRAPSTRIACEADASSEPLDHTINHSSNGRRQNRTPATLHINEVPPPTSATRILDIATDADFSFFKIYGEQTNAYIRAILNATNAIYSSSLGVRLRISAQRAARSGDIPSGPITALRLLEEYRQSQFATTSNADVRHLFTGRSIDGLTIGIAYIGTVCAAGGGYAVGLSTSVNPGIQPLLAAHEIGHNLSAVHDNEPQSIMNPKITEANNRFSAGAIANISSFIKNRGSCIGTYARSRIRLGLDPSDPKRFVANVNFTVADITQCSVDLFGSSDGKRYVRVASRTTNAPGEDQSMSVTFDAKAPSLVTGQNFFFKSRVTCEAPRTVITSQPAKLRYGFAASSKNSSPRDSDKWLAALRESLKVN